MNVQEIQKIIEISHDAVKNEKNELFKLEAFKIILTKLLLDYSEDIDHNVSNKNIIRKNIEITENVNAKGNHNDEGFAKLASNCKVTVEELTNVLSIKDDKIQFLSTSFEGTDKTRQINATQCILACYEVVLQKNWIQSHTILECLGDIGIFDPNRNFASNIKSKREFFIKNPKSQEYRLTIPKGRDSAYDIIKKLANGETIT